MSMSSWSWEKVERRLKRHIAKAERQLVALQNYRVSALGETLGITPSTPCDVIEDDTDRRKRRKRIMGKKPFKGAVVCHRCDTPKCIAFDHIFYGTQGDNLRDCYLKGRHPNGSSNVEERIAKLNARLFLWRLQLTTRTLIDETTYDDSFMQESP